MLIPWDKPVCLSGGAIGADLFWGDAARHAGHDVMHLSFHGHRTSCRPSEQVILTDTELRAADVYAFHASKVLKRRYPPRDLFVQNLLRRNWYQIAKTDAVYAISSIDRHGLVTGGTGWAVTYFLNRHGHLPCSLYVFDQEQCHWYEWNGYWMSIYEPPFPSGVWAGIGTRKINLIGRLAIGALMNYWPKQRTVRNR